MEDRASLLRVQPLVESDSTVNRAKKGPTAVPSTWWLVLLTMWCGIVNNASFCVLLGASLEIANEFGQSRYQPLIVNISTLGSVIGVFLSSRLMVGRMTDRERLALVVTGNVAGYALIAIAYRVAPWDSEPHTAGPDETPPSWGFWLCCAGACVLGFFQSCGEVLNLGVCRVFDPSMLAGWGAGTGVSGIVGPFLFVALHSAVDLDIGQIALVMLGMLPLYVGALWLILARRDAALAGRGAPSSSSPPSSSTTLAASSPSSGGGGGALPLGVDHQDRHDNGEEAMAAAAADADADDAGKGGKDGGGGAAVAESLSLANLAVVWRFCGSVLVNMVAVYALEYLVTAGLLQIVTECPANGSWLADSDNNNPLLWAMYNVGVTLSRASVSCFRIRRVWVLTALQAANVAVWATFAFTQWIARWHEDAPLYLAAAHMVFVGFMGGAVYANCMYLFNTNDVPERFRELGINVGFLFSNLGIIAATGFVVLLKATVLSKGALFPPDGECPPLPEATYALFVG